jgi:fumarate hydratase class I
MYTGRDAAHAFLMEEFRPEFRERLKDRIIYHCGPVVRDCDGSWEFISAGPTTSAREEVYQADVIEQYGIRGVIGKGGMGKRTLEACGKFGAVYLHAVGGAGALTASSVKRVTNVFMLEEFGVPEAIWEIEVEGFPAIVTMDSHGKSLHEDVKRKSMEAFERLVPKKG